jgi:hypothetical protein
MLTITQKKRKARLQNLANGQERVIKLLDKITQEHADMDLVDFIDMYLVTKAELKASKKMGNIESCFFEAEMNQLNNDMEDELGISY